MSIQNLSLSQVLPLRGDRRTPALPCGAAVLALLTLAGCSHLSSAVQTGRQLPATEVRQLFVGQTVTSKNLSNGVVSVSRYAPNGQVQQQRQGQQRTGTWRVMPDGRMCLRMENNNESCRWIRQETDGRYQKYSQTHAFARPVITYVGLTAPRARTEPPATGAPKPGVKQGPAQGVVQR